MLAQTDPQIWSIMLTGLIVACVLGVIPLAVLAWFIRRKQHEAQSDAPGRSPDDAA